MTVFLVILSVVLWGCSIWALLTRLSVVGPAASYLALFVLSFAKTSLGVSLLPINNTVLVWWLSITLVVIFISVMQSPAVTAQTRGCGYMTVGAVAGMTVGLLANTFTLNMALIYALMVIATLVGTFFGFLLFTNTPSGSEVGLRTGRFFKYLLAKGFNIAVTVMMIGVALVLAIARYNTAPLPSASL